MMKWVNIIKNLDINRLQLATVDGAEIWIEQEQNELKHAFLIRCHSVIKENGLIVSNENEGCIWKPQRGSIDRFVVDHIRFIAGLKQDVSTSTIYLHRATNTIWEVSPQGTAMHALYQNGLKQRAVPNASLHEALEQMIQGSLIRVYLTKESRTW